MQAFITECDPAAMEWSYYTETRLSTHWNYELYKIQLRQTSELQHSTIDGLIVCPVGRSCSIIPDTHLRPLPRTRRN
jgi:hypothetical protein